MAKTRISVTLADTGEYVVPPSKTANLYVTSNANLASILVVPASTSSVTLTIDTATAGSPRQYPLMLKAGDKIRGSGSSGVIHIGGDLYDIV